MSYAPYDSLDLFTFDGPKVVLASSSCNPIYYKYGDDEVEFFPCLGHLIYYEYCDDEVELGRRFEDPIYDNYDDVEEVIENFLTERIGQFLLSRDFFCSSCT